MPVEPSAWRSREARRIDVIRLIGVLAESDLAAAKLLVVRVVGMPSKHCR